MGERKTKSSKSINKIILLCQSIKLNYHSRE